MKKWLFLFLLLIPTQLGLHFWPEWSYILGLRVDYLSPTLYLLDLVWIGLFIVESRKLKVKSVFKWSNLILVIFIGINIWVAENHWVAGYRWVRVAQLIWTIWYLRKGGHPPQAGRQGPPVQKYLKWIIPCWIIFESFLGWAQVVNSGSLNGIFYWLGERSFNFNTIGIAQISILGEGFVRAYGTFSHPNSLGGFLLVALILWWRYRPVRGLFLKTLWWVVIWSGVLGIMVSGSRLIWLLFVLIIGYWFFRKIKLGWSLVFLGLLLIFFGIFGNKNILSGWDKESFSKRIELNLISIKMFKENPLFGVGVGNFLVKLPDYQENNGLRWLQPVHNIPLLLLSEIGLVGVIFLIYLIRKFKFKKLLLVWGVILVTAMFDHYWLTLPQNWWMLGIVLSLGGHAGPPVQNPSRLRRFSL